MAEGRTFAEWDAEFRELYGGENFTLDREQVALLLGYVDSVQTLPGEQNVPPFDLLGTMENAVPQIIGLREEPCGCIEGMACSDWDCPG